MNQSKTELPYKKHIIKLFNEGALNMNSINWYVSQGYAFICKSGKVVDIIKERTN